MRQLGHAVAESHSEMVRWREQSLEYEQAAARFEALDLENSMLRDQAAKLAAIESTVSWRVTRPLRTLRRAQLRRGHSDARQAHITDDAEATTLVFSAERDLREALARRLVQAATVLLPAETVEVKTDLRTARVAIERAVAASDAPIRAKVWLALVAADGSYPDKPAVDRAARLLRMHGPSALGDELFRRFGEALRAGRRPTSGLHVVHDGLVVDVSHTVSHDLHTGIQRVVRETVSRWLDAGHEMSLVHFDVATRWPRLLAGAEARRLVTWRDHLSPSGARMIQRTPRYASDDVVVPWGSRLILPELVAEPDRCESYRSAASAGVLRSFSLIGYDLIPMTAAETVSDGISATFGHYLSMVKCADRVAAISRSSARDFAAFAQMAASQGLPGPEVVAYELPTEVPELSDEMIEKARVTLGVGAGPLVLVVGSHEPRKNQVAVLEAAERLWAHGADFELLLIGGSGWKGEEFDEVVEHLRSLGRPLKVRKRSSETELWAAYRLARFTVFPSLLEGFGLPVAESLASGTPVITSNYGSMAEIAELGGSLLVDPRDIDALEREMSHLLEDDDALDRLREEAAKRPAQTWSDYAVELWRFFVEMAP